MKTGRKNIQRPSDGNLSARTSNGFLVESEDIDAEKIVSVQDASKKPSHLNSDEGTLSRRSTLPNEYRTDLQLTADTPLCSLPANAVGYSRQFNCVHHIYSPRSPKNSSSRSQNLPSPSHSDSLAKLIFTIAIVQERCASDQRTASNSTYFTRLESTREHQHRPRK